MKHSFLLTLCAICFFTASCSDSDATGTEKRSFYMGVTPWPGDFTVAEVDTAYQFINQHCDIVSHHFDDGIPYEEAFNEQPMPAQLQQDIQYRITRTSANKKILLSVSALNLTRIHKADYYTNSTVSGTIQDNWENLPVNHPDVILAYKNYMSWLIDSFQPDYINYGVESNVATFPNADFTIYKDFISQVYPYLKNKYPNIPLFVSFIVDETSEGLNNATQLIPYTDYVGLSAYPYVTVSSSASGNTNPALFPANYFERFINLANKPLVIAETAYIAEDLVIPSFSLNKQGTEAWQKDYLEKMCQLCNTHQAEFLIWFCSKDYDNASQTLITMGLYQDLFGLWQDTGLKNENGQQRPSYTSWLQWMAKEKN